VRAILLLGRDQGTTASRTGRSPSAARIELAEGEMAGAGRGRSRRRARAANSYLWRAVLAAPMANERGPGPGGSTVFQLNRIEIQKPKRSTHIYSEPPGFLRYRPDLGSFHAGEFLSIGETWWENMKRTGLALILMFAGLALYGAQALIWRAGARGRTETDVENRAGHHPVTEVPVLAGTVLLLLAGTILSIPRHDGE
jgi:hypothetical protein